MNLQADRREIPDPSPPPPPAAPGPQVHSAIVTIDGPIMTLQSNAPFAPASVATSAFSVSTWTANGGWHSRALRAVSRGAGCETVRIDHAEEPQSTELLRLIAKGTGRTPILGANSAPLAGAAGSTGATDHEGEDFVRMLAAP